MKITILEDKEDEYYVITSPDVPSLLLCSRDRNEIWADIPTSVEILTKLNKEKADHD